MANNVAANPWSIDTASGTNLADGEVHIRSIQWINPSAAGHVAQVADATGRVWWQRVSAASRENHETEFHGDIGRVMPGLRVPTIDSGTLFITFYVNGG